MSDERLRQLERRLRAEPGDVALALELANERVRLGLRRPATSWEREEGGRNYFASVGPRQVVVGERGSSPFDEAAGSVSHAAFLQGQYQDTVLRNLGPEVLAEMLEAALRAPELLPLPSLGLRAAVGIGDRFYVATDSYLVVEPTGEVIRPPRRRVVRERAPARPRRAPGRRRGLLLLVVRPRAGRAGAAALRAREGLRGPL